MTPIRHEPPSLTLAAPVRLARLYHPELGALLVEGGAGWDRAVLDALLAAHRTGVAEGRCLKQRRETLVTRCVLAGGVPRGPVDGPVGGAGPIGALVVKTVELEPRRRWWYRIGGRAPGRRAFRVVAALRARGVEAPAVCVAALRPRRSDLLVTRFVPAPTLGEALWLAPTALSDSAQRVRVWTALGRWVRHLHEAGIWQRDLKSANVLVLAPASPAPRFVLLDTVDVRLLNRPLPAHRCQRNLAQVLDVPLVVEPEAWPAFAAGYALEPARWAHWEPVVRGLFEARCARRLRIDGHLRLDEHSPLVMDASRDVLGT